MKKIVSLLLIVGMCLVAFAGCSTLQGDNDKGATINLYFGSFPMSLDPAAVQLDADTSTIMGLIYEPLTSISKDGTLTGALAEEWYIKYDTRDEVWKLYFKLKTTSWSDGIQVTAEHVIYAWKRILDPATESPFAAPLYVIKNAKKVKSGEFTSEDLGIYAESETLVCIYMEQNFENQSQAEEAMTLFAEDMSNIAYSPLRENIIVKAQKDNPVGSDGYDRTQDWDKSAAIIVCNGPFKVQAFEEGKKITLERNAYYYRDEEDDDLDESVIPYRLNCVFQETTIINAPEEIIDQDTFQYNRFKSGASYFLSGFSKSTYEAANPKNTQSILSTYSFFFNTKSEVLSDAKTRQALSAAIDREEIASILGCGATASTGFVPSGVFDTKAGTDFRKNGDSIYSTTADTETAKSLVSQSGAKGELKVVYIIPWSKDLYGSEKFGSVKKYVQTYNPYEEIANNVKEKWEALGFKVTLTGVYADRYNETLASGNWDVIGIDFVINSVDALSYLAPFATYYSGNVVSINVEQATYTPHYTGLESAEYDALIDKICGFDTSDDAKILTRAERTALLHEAETMFASLCPATAVVQYSRSYVVSNKLDGIESDSIYGYIDFNNLKLDDYISVNSRENAESQAIEASRSAMTNQ